MIGINTGKITKKKRVSKKKKIAWRKHVNINDVEDFLENQRQEERLGKPLDNVPDNQLFVVDTTPTTERKLLTKKEKRRLMLEKPLKCFSALRPFTNVPDPVSKRNKVRTKEQRKSQMVKQKEAEKLVKGNVQQKYINAVTERQKDVEKRAQKPSKHDFNKDIWKEDIVNLQVVPDLDKNINKEEWLETDVKRHLLHERGKTVRRVPASVQVKQSIIPAIELPHPGTSYNPSYNDHQELLKMIVEKEQEIIKQEEHLKRVTSGMFSKVTVSQRDKSWLSEMSEGLPKPEDKQEDDASDNELKSVNPPVKNKEKSKQQRRKQKEQKDLEEKRHKLKIEKKKLADLNRIRKINEQIEKEKAKAKMLHEKRLKKAEYQKLEAKRLGNVKFEEPELDCNLASELTGNLRTFKTAGNILSDRFKSLQKRSIIEPTVRHIKKKIKNKKIKERKDDWKKTMAWPKKQ